MEQIARAQSRLVNQVRILQAFETRAVIILAARVKAVIILADITGNDVTIHSQTRRIICDTDSGVLRLQSWLAVVQHEQAAIARHISKFFQQRAHLRQTLGAEVGGPVVPTDICHRLQVVATSFIPLEWQPQHLRTICRLDIHIVVNRVHSLTDVGTLCYVNPAVGIIPRILYELVWCIHHRLSIIHHEAYTHKAHIATLLCAILTGIAEIYDIFFRRVKGQRDDCRHSLMLAGATGFHYGASIGRCGSGKASA